MIGDTPQPGETPRSEGDPWSFADPDLSWWHGETEPAAGAGAADPPTGGARPRGGQAQHQAAPSGGVSGGTGTLLPPGEVERERTGAAAEAHAAATRDVGEELDPRLRAEPTIAERDHDAPDPHRYDPLAPPAGHTARTTTETVAADHTPPAGAHAAPEDATAEDATAQETTTHPPRVGAHAAPEETPDETAPPPPGPDVMVLPEPSTRNRATVPLDRPMPGLTRQSRGRHHPTEPLPPATGSPHTDARLEKLENSPFWTTDPEKAVEPPPVEKPARAAARRRSHRSDRRPVRSMIALVVLALVAAFFAWVSAEPFWLAVGHGEGGIATTTHCTGSGVTQRCAGRFAAADGGFAVARVTLLGVGPAERVPGTVAPARMVSRDSTRAYLGDPSPLLQLRWTLGFILVMFCGYAIAGLTGARRLTTGRARRGAVLASLAGPVLLLAGFLIAAY